MGLDRCKIVKYSGLPDSTDTYLSSYRYFLLLLIYLSCTTNVRIIYFIWIYPSAAGSGMSQSLSVFVESLLFLPERVEDQETVCDESPQLKKLKE
jgi:hypothetical protein